MENEITEKKEKQLEFIMANIIELGKYSYSLQVKREESLLNQAGRMITACSVVTAIYSFMISKTINFSTVIFFIGLLLSFAFAVMASWRFKKNGMEDIDAFYNAAYEDNESFNTQIQIDRQWKYQISSLHKSIKRINDKRARYLLISMITFIFSIAIAIISMIF